MPYANIEDRKRNGRKRYAERKANGTLVGYSPVKNVRHLRYMAGIREKFGYWYSRRYILKHRYGLTLEAFYALVEDQDSRCAICRKALDLEPGHQKRSDGVTIDHDHETGAVRGLLHRRCNSWLAPLEHDNGVWMAQALKYLAK
jgi:hypothetical protein